MDKNVVRLIEYAFASGASVSECTDESVGTFTLGDAMTCGNKRRNAAEACDEHCDRSLIRIHSEDPLTIVGFDKLVQADEEKCDYFIFDSGMVKTRFALCELTCSLEKYVYKDASSGKAGKREKAFRQMMNTWQRIVKNENPALMTHIYQYIKKSALFGWRERRSNLHNAAIRNMERFGRTPGCASGISVYPQYAFGEIFEFVQIKYPSVYNWK